MILLAEDDDDLRTLLASALRREGYEVTEVSTGAQLLDQITSALLSGSPVSLDLIVSDIRMPGASGLQVLEALRHYHAFPPMVLITAFGSDETHEAAVRLGAAAVLDKPFDVDDLLGIVRDLAPQPDRSR